MNILYMCMFCIYFFLINFSSILKAMQEGRHVHNNESTSINGICFFFCSCIAPLSISNTFHIYNNNSCLHFQPHLWIMHQTSIFWKMLLISYKGEHYIHFWLFLHPCYLNVVFRMSYLSIYHSLLFLHNIQSFQKYPTKAKRNFHAPF